jgi:hypothetical protein
MDVTERQVLRLMNPPRGNLNDCFGNLSTAFPTQSNGAKALERLDSSLWTAKLVLPPPCIFGYR